VAHCPGTIKAKAEILISLIMVSLGLKILFAVLGLASFATEMWCLMQSIFGELLLLRTAR
jgi:hypothetical protein